MAVKRVIRVGCAERREIPEADRAASVKRFNMRARDVYTVGLFGAVQELLNDADLREAVFRNIDKGLAASGADAIVISGHEGCAMIEDDQDQINQLFMLAEIVAERFGVEVQILWQISKGKDKGWIPCWLHTIPARPSTDTPVSASASAA